MEKDANQTPGKPTRSPGRYVVFDTVAVALLSLATVGSAWCSYQASSWGSRSSKLSSQSVIRAHAAATVRVKANQMFLLDVFLFSQYVNARNTSNEPLARIYAREFPAGLKEAFEKWQRARPHENADAPGNPFATNYYQPPFVAEADQIDSESDRFWQLAEESDKTSRRYILTTVLLAAALFFGGTAPQLKTPKGRRAVLWLGLLVLFVSFFTFFKLPILPASRPATLQD
jgi:hypothetical protein